MGNDGCSIVRWTGAGDREALEATASKRLSADGVRSAVYWCGTSLIVAGADPSAAAESLENLPGVAWVAAGLEAEGPKELGLAAGVLARRYLRRGERFAVSAEASGRPRESDVSGTVIAGILDAVKGTRVSEDRPKVKFRTALDGKRGVVGVELREGPGGLPTGKQGVEVLVSGGLHSSVVAWMSLVAGLKVTLVHAASGDGALKAVARLYLELEGRVDPGALGLKVLEGGGTGSLVRAWVKGHAGDVMTGFHAPFSFPKGLEGEVRAPLYLLPEGQFDALFRGLSLAGLEGRTTWDGAPSKWSSRSFAGPATQVSDVLEGLSRQRLP